MVSTILAVGRRAPGLTGDLVDLWNHSIMNVEIRAGTDSKSVILLPLRKDVGPGEIEKSAH